MSSVLTKITAVQVLRIAAFCLFLGRSWQFLFLRTPFHIWLPEAKETHWLIILLGIFFLGNAIISLIVREDQTVLKSVLLFSILPLLVMTFAMWQNKEYQFAQVIEQTAQWTTPLFLWLFLSKFRPTPLLWVAVALVFTGHGMYAAGIYPQPAHFHFMVTRILGISGSAGSAFLMTAGILDFIVSIGVFVPKIRRVSLMYMVIWGTLTSFARIIAYSDPANFGPTFIEWAPQTIFRLPHALLPLTGLLLLEKHR